VTASMARLFPAQGGYAHATTCGFNRNGSAKSRVSEERDVEQKLRELAARESRTLSGMIALILARAVDKKGWLFPMRSPDRHFVGSAKTVIR